MLNLVIAALFITPALASAAVRSEINIDQSGKIVAKNLKVAAIPEPGKSTFFFARALWDNVYIRITVVTGATTKITKEHGEQAGVFDIKEGDLVDVEGVFPSSADTLNVQASKIVDHSLLREVKTVRGTVSSLATSTPEFVLKTSKGNNITVRTGSGTIIKKGARIISLSGLKIGDTILSAKGLFDYSAYSIDADSIEVYQNKTVFRARNFEGKLESLSDLTLPTTLNVNVDGKTYTVYLPAKADILNKNKSPVQLSRFVAGDKVRFYGAVRETDLSAIDADTLRDLNF